MYRLLVVCLGNICRSPTAEGVLRKAVKDRGLVGQIEIASAGTDACQGALPDTRAKKAAELRGYDLSGIRARSLLLEDFAKFNLILAVDQRVLRMLYKVCPSDYLDKLGLLMSYGQHFIGEEMPDPYYGNSDGFERVLDMVEDVIPGLMETFKRHLVIPH